MIHIMSNFDMFAVGTFHYGSSIAFDHSIFTIDFSLWNVFHDLIPMHFVIAIQLSGVHVKFVYCIGTVYCVKLHW